MILYCRKCYEEQEAKHRYFACRHCGDRDGRGLSKTQTYPATPLLKPRVQRRKATGRQLTMLRGATGQGKPLAIWLARRKSTKTSFAEEMGVSRQTVDNWLKRGTAWPRHAHAIYYMMVRDGVRPALLHREAKARWEEVCAADRS